MLRVFLLANCLSCAAFGTLFVLWPVQSAEFIGTPPVIVILALGALLLINAALLAMTAMKWTDNRLIISFFVLGDVMWVLATLLCLVLGVWIAGIEATIAAITVAIIVGYLGLGQYRHGIKK